MTTERRQLKGIKGQYEFVAPLRSDDLSQHFLAVNRSAAGDARFVVVRESLPAVIADKALLAEFLKELRVTSRFKHAGLERTIETGRTKTSYFAITEFLLGDGLGRLLNEARRLGKRLPAALAAGLIARAAEGLDHAHRVEDSRGQPLGVLHHHVHPNSLVLLYHGAVKVVDFDIRRKAFRIEAGVPKGEVAYSSPEQSLQRQLGPATDVFSLGVVLWELLAERRLFYRRSQVDTLRAIQAGELPTLSGRADLPDDLMVVARRAIERDPTKRWETAAKMAEALDGAMRGLGAETGELELGSFIRSVLGEREKHKRALLQTCLEEELEAADLSRLLVDQLSQPIWLPQPAEAARPRPPEKPEPRAPVPTEPGPGGSSQAEILPRTELIDLPAGALAGGADADGDEQPATRASQAEIHGRADAEDPVAAGRAEPAAKSEVPSLPPRPVVTSASIERPPAEAKDLTPPQAGTGGEDEEPIEYIEEELQPAPPELQPSPPPAPAPSQPPEPPPSKRPGQSIRISMPGAKAVGRRSKLPPVLGAAGAVAVAIVLAVVFWPGLDEPDQADVRGGPGQVAVPDAGATQEPDADAGRDQIVPDAPARPDAHPPAEPPAPEPEPGSIEAASLEVRTRPPGCKVWLDGARLDDPTPLSGVQLEPDRAYRVSIACRGHALVKRRITPKPGEQVVLDLSPARKTSVHRKRAK